MAQTIAMGSALALIPSAVVAGVLHWRIRRLRERANAALADRSVLGQSEELFRSLVQSAVDVLLLVDEGGKIRFASASARRTLGRHPEELVGADVAELAFPDDARKVRGLLADCTSDSSASQSIDLRVRRGTSSHLAHVEAVANNRLGDPSVNGIVISLRDITRRKWAEEALRSAETKYRTLVEQLPLVTYIDKLDDQSSAVYMSPQIEALLGYSPEEWLADPGLFTKLLHPDDRERVLAEVARTNETEQPFVCKYRLIARDGRVVWFHDEGVTVRDEAGRPLYAQGYLIDVSAQNAAEGDEARTKPRRLRSL